MNPEYYKRQNNGQKIWTTKHICIVPEWNNKKHRPCGAMVFVGAGGVPELKNSSGIAHMYATAHMDIAFPYQWLRKIHVRHPL